MQRNNVKVPVKSKKKPNNSTIDGIEGKMAGDADVNSRSNRQIRGSQRRSSGGWFWSFCKLGIVISGFILFVYIYDENLVYGFALKAGWHIKADENRMKSAENVLKSRDQPQNPNEEVEKGVENDAVNFQKNKQEQASEIEKSKDNEDLGGFKYHVLQSLTNVHTKPHLKTRFEECTRSILSKASIDLHFFFVVDGPSKKYIMEIMQVLTDEGVAKSRFQFSFMDIDDLAKDLAPHVSMLQEHVTGHHPYYKDSIFFLSVALHENILPPYVHQVAMMDTDLKFMTDIKELFDLFGNFEERNIMGIAREQQPVYRHIFSYYRSKNPGTRVGDPPPDGLTGFNSGVLLIDINRMRKSSTYKKYLDGSPTKALAEKYAFKGHLGDQDFFSLLSLEHPELFYILPCSWNRQLCQWWKDKGYANIFDLYFRCPEPIHIYHGNCNTKIPV